MNLARAEFRQQRVEVAVDKFYHARRAYEMLLRARTDEVEHRFDLAVCERSIGELEAARKNFQIAQEHLERAKKLFQELAAEFPGKEKYVTQRERCGAALAQIERILEKQRESAGG
jgi:tetratricopeptide (TPR) repeat protein